MAQTIRVTSAQREAAELLLERAERLGHDVDPAVRAIAQAQPAERSRRRGRAMSGSREVRSSRRR